MTKSCAGIRIKRVRSDEEFGKGPHTREMVRSDGKLDGGKKYSRQGKNNTETGILCTKTMGDLHLT